MRDEGGAGPKPVTVVYLCGIGRSGSTLLTRALGSADGAFAAGEVMHLFGRGWRRNEACACGEPVRACPAWGGVIRRLDAEGLPRPPGEIEAFRDRLTEGHALLAPFLPLKPRRLRARLAEYRALLSRVYRALRDVTDADVIVDSSKSPAYARILAGVAGLDLRLVHLVRDSRGVVHSLGKRKRRPGTTRRDALLDHRSAGAGALLWSAANALAEHVGGRAGACTRVRYEDFVTAPSATLSEVLRMAGVSEPAGRLGHVEERTVRLAVHHVLAGNPVRAETGAVRLHEDVAWRSAMPTATRGLVTALTFPLLHRYGYTTARAGGASVSRGTRVAV